MNRPGPEHRVAALSLALALTTACTSVGVGGFSFTSNEEIAEGTRSDMGGKCAATLAAIREGNVERVKSLFTREALAQVESSPGLNDFIALLQQATTGTYTVEEQHHIHGSSAGVFTPTLVITEPEPHTIVLPPVSGEAYFILLSFDQEYQHQAVGLHFLKREHDWKLHTAYAGGLIAAGSRRARSWYEEARSYAERGFPIAAALRLAAASRCLRPIPTMQYSFESEFMDFARTVQRNVSQLASFPLPLDEISGRPTILRLDVAFGDDQLVPVVDYLTSTPLDSLPEITGQASAIEQLLPTRLPGFCEGGTIYMLKAFNENPTDPSRQYPFYGIKKQCP